MPGSWLSSTRLLRAATLEGTPEVCKSLVSESEGPCSAHELRLEQVMWPQFP